MAEEPLLNSIDRFRKRPERIVLEEHGHCEIPAGCGGVVLRWRNPQTAVPVTIHLYTPAKIACFIDGAPLQTGRIDLAPGMHVFSVHFEKVDLSVGLMMVAAKHDPKEYQRTLPTAVIEPPFTLVSAADRTWKFTLSDPGSESWKSLEFDDVSWPSLTTTTAPKLDPGASGAFQCRRCRDLGAACLGLPRAASSSATSSWLARVLGRDAEKKRGGTTGSVWIRKVFEVAGPLRSEVRP
jgi:hypothetical protein